MAFGYQQMNSYGNLQGNAVRINRGGPDSVEGILIASGQDYLVILAKDGVVYIRTSHVKSLTESLASKGKSKGSKGRTGHNIVRAQNFYGVLNALKHRKVQINRGGPEKVEGVLADLTNDNLIIIVKNELVRVQIYHVKSITVKGGNSGSKNNNQNKNDNKNENKNENKSSGKSGGKTNGKAGGSSGNKSGAKVSAATGSRTGGAGTGGRTRGKTGGAGTGGRTRGRTGGAGTGGRTRGRTGGAGTGGRTRGRTGGAGTGGRTRGRTSGAGTGGRTRGKTGGAGTGGRTFGTNVRRVGNGTTRTIQRRVASAFRWTKKQNWDPFQ